MVGDSEEDYEDDFGRGPPSEVGGAMLILFFLGLFVLLLLTGFTGIIYEIGKHILGVWA
jgi:hypothetical protein